MTVMVDRREYDIRISSIPTVHGEKIVMRISSKLNLTREIKELGLDSVEMETLQHMLAKPYGILFVTGPTGSGKSTTLYTALSALNKEQVNIVTVEDPVEADIEGINQIQVNNKVDLTFASALRSILRQDPDIIMIGEIRDKGDCFYCCSGFYYRTFGCVDYAYKQCSWYTEPNRRYGNCPLSGCRCDHRSNRTATCTKALPALPPEKACNG